MQSSTVLRQSLLRAAAGHTARHAIEANAQPVAPAPTEPPAKPKRRRSRIKGADTTPDVEGLPS